MPHYLSVGQWFPYDPILNDQIIVIRTKLWQKNRNGSCKAVITILASYLNINNIFNFFIKLISKYVQWITTENIDVKSLKKKHFFFILFYLFVLLWSCGTFNIYTQSMVVCKNFIVHLNSYGMDYRLKKQILRRFFQNF